MTSRRLRLMASDLPASTPDHPEMTPDMPDHGGEAATSSATTPTLESRELQRMRVERDAALEELAFLREQLRSAEAFYAYRFELECARLYAEHRGFLEEITRLGADFHRRSRSDDPMREEARLAPSDPIDPASFHG